MELTIPGVANDPPLVDQHEARPVTDAVRVPGAAVVVLRIGIGDALPRERPREIALVVLTRGGWELRRMDADNREPPLPRHSILRQQRRHPAGAGSARGHTADDAH